MKFPWKLIDRSVDLALLTSGLLDHQLNVLVVKNTDQVAFWVTVVEGNVFHLEYVSGKGEQVVALQQKGKIRN